MQQACGRTSLVGVTRKQMVSGRRTKRPTQFSIERNPIGEQVDVPNA
jgi:hypothetical protein